MRYLLGLGPRHLEEIWPDRGQSCLRPQPLTLPDHYDYDLQVIVPVYNVGRYLRESLVSLFSQELDYRMCVVCVNDGSTDDSAQVLAEYASKYPDLKVITQKNQGLSAARNHAIELMLAPRLFFFDSDDRLEPGALQRLMEQSLRTGADFTEGGICKFNDAGIRDQPKTHPTADHCASLMGFACNKVIRLEVFREVQFPVGYLYEDTLLSMLLFWRFTHYATVEGVSYWYRFNSTGSLSTTRHMRKIDSYWVTCRMCEDYLQSGGTLTQAYRDNLEVEFSNALKTIAPLHRWDVNALVRREIQSFKQRYCL